MRLEVEPALREEVVFLEMRRLEDAGDLRAFAAIRRRVDALYDAAPEGEERERAFRREHTALFRELGYEAILTSALGDFPLVGGGVEKVAFRRATRAQEEGSELFMPARADGGPGPALRFALKPERFLDRSTLRTYLQAELLRISDMLDPRFAYEPDLGTAEASPAEKDRVRDRYRTLWDAYVAARLGDPTTPGLTHAELLDRAREGPAAP